MIKAIGNNGGVMGLNFCPYFVADKGEHLFADDLAVHVKHMIHTGGLESVAIGTDFDGMNGILEIEHIGQIEKLAHALTR
ncbi:Peptidase M19 like protein, partial [Aduncisulcus paluster]